jgi:heptaprenyl diphosphate synthase
LGVHARAIGLGKQEFEFSLENTGALIEKIEAEILNELSDSKGAISEMCNHILRGGGKRVRPLLVLYSGKLFSEPGENLIKAAVAAELIHMASLVHDDIIDVSMLRRKLPSVNCSWGNSFAVLCGDYLFAKAFGILSKNRLMNSMDFMVEAIQNMCHGEILQAGDKYSQGTNLDIYYERIAKKTAIFLGCCCKSGACVGGANSMQVQIMGEYGLNIGLAFQIIDDILDFYGNSDVMGKPKYEDISQGNITIPIILLMMNEKYSSWLRKVISAREFSQSDIDRVYFALSESNVIEECYKLAGLHAEKAKKCLDILPESPYKSLLYSMADVLMTRNS